LTEPSAGALSGDRHLKNKGRVEEAKGSAKKTVDKVADTLTNGIGPSRGRLSSEIVIEETVGFSLAGRRIRGYVGRVSTELAAESETCT
jgi:hypothetical protein